MLTSSFFHDSPYIGVHEMLVPGSLMNATRQTGSIALQVVQGSLGFGTTHAYTLAKTARPTVSAFPTKGTNCIATPHWMKKCGKLCGNEEYRLTPKRYNGACSHTACDELSCDHAYQKKLKNDYRSLLCTPPGWCRDLFQPPGAPSWGRPNERMSSLLQIGSEFYCVDDTQCRK